MPARPAVGSHYKPEPRDAMDSRQNRACWLPVGREPLIAIVQEETAMTESDMPRSPPAWVSYISPFRLIMPDDEEPLEVSLDEINANTYNHGKLCRIVDAFETRADLPVTAICCDGAISSPICSALAEKESAVTHFSRLLCELLLGGTFCEAIDQRDVATGSLSEDRAIWPVNLGSSLSSQMHATLRMRIAGPLHTITLAKPRYIRVSKFHEALAKGRGMTEALTNLSPHFLLRGVTEVYYRNWSAALGNLWITIEQLTEFLWQNRFLSGDGRHPQSAIDGRNRALRDDHRTYSTSIRQELMYQSGLLSDHELSALFPARQARNRLVHQGVASRREDAVAALDAISELLRVATGHKTNLRELDIDILQDAPDDHVAVPHTVSESWRALSPFSSVDN